jgi:uncharacterized membrane protein
MAEDSTSPDKLKQLDDRLNYLESVARETVARLYAVEKHLGLVFKAVPKHLDQPAPTDEQARDSRLRAVEEALKRVPPIAPEKPAPEEFQTKPREVKPATEEVQTKPTAEVPSPEPPLTESQVRDVPPSRPVADESPTKIPAVAPPTEDRPSGKEPQTPVPPARDRRVLGAPVPQGPPPPAPRVRPAAPSIAPGAFAKRGDLEARIGGNWFNRIGIIAIFLGVTFFLKYAIDNEWIGPTGRVLIGVAIGLGFLALGERLRKRYPSYAYGLTGGGIAILYASIWFASGNKYGLLSQTVAFGMMALVTATASLLSARYNALPIAVLGLIGGFLTPILLSTGVDNEAALFTYIAFLDLGVLALAYSKQWRSLNYMAFISTVLMFAGWMSEWYTSEKLWTTMIFLTVLFAIFALLAVLYNVVNRRPTGWLDLAMVFSNALLYFGTSYELLDDHNHGILGLFALLVSVFYMGLGYFTFRRDRDDNLLILTFLGLSFLFAVLAVPIQFDQHWVTMCWAIEGAVMSWIGLRANDRTSRNAALVVFGIAIAHWFYVDMRQFAYHANETFTPLFNLRAFSCAVLVASLSASVWFYKKTRSDVSDDERSMFRGLYLLAANTMAVILLSLDANDYFNQKKAGVPLAGTEKNQLDNAHYFTISALWSIYGAAALIVGIKRRLKPIRAAAMLLLAAATALVLALNLSYYSAPWHTVAFNETFGAFALLIGALSSGAWFYAKEKNINSDERRAALGLLIGAANLLAIVALSAEALGHFDRAQSIASGEIIAHLENSKQFALTAVWTIFGATALAVGIRRRSEAVRTGSLLLLALTTAKVGAVDVQYYNARWHSLLFNPTFGAFSLLVLSLTIGAWLYASAKDVSDRERGAAIRLLIGVSSLLLVVAFSAEALGYYDRAQALSSGEVVRQLENTKQLALSSVWVVFGCAALIIGVQRRLRALRIGALLLLAVATLKALFVDLRYYDAGWHNLLLNPTFAVFALLIAGFALSVWFYARAEDIPERERGVLIPVLLGAANLLAIVSLSAEAIGYFSRARAQLGVAQLDDFYRFNNNEQFVLSALWAIYGAAALAIATFRVRKSIRWGALVLLVIATAKVLVEDTHFYDSAFHTLVFNQTFGAFLLLIGALSCGVWAYSRADLLDDGERTRLLPIMVTAANLLAIIALSLEALGHYTVMMGAPGLAASRLADLRLAQQLSISVVWTIYGGAMLTFGMARRSRLLRIMGLLLLGLTIFKVFLFDLSSLERLYRIISFIVLGLILLAVSFLYQRYRQRVAELIGDVDAEAPAGAE